MAFFRSLATVGGFTAASRVLGFIRDILIAAVVGTGPIADAFFVAFRFPNLFRRLFAEGAFNAAFVPLFARRLEEEGRQSALAFAEEALAALLTLLLVLSVVAMATMPWLMWVLAPGFSAEPEKFDLAVQLSRICFPYLIFMALLALLAGILNSLRRFAAAAAAPIVLNVFFIASLLFLVPGSDKPGHVMAWTVAAAGIGQFLLLVVACARLGLRPRLPWPRLTSGVRRLAQLMVPGLLSAGAMQINLMIGTIIASLQAGAVSYLYYADRVYQLPLGMIGIAFGVVLLPELSRQLRSGAEQDAMASLNRGLEFALLLTLPATVALVIIPWPIVVVLFERGIFDRSASEATAMALAAFALGLPAYVLVKVLQPAYFAREDTVTPLKLALVGVAANVALSLILFWPFGHVGIALATALSAWLNALLLAVTLLRRGFLHIDARFRQRLPRIAMASVLMGVVVAAGNHWGRGFFSEGQVVQVVALAGLVFAGLLSYGGFVLAVRAVTTVELTSLFRRSSPRS